METRSKIKHDTFLLKQRLVSVSSASLLLMSDFILGHLDQHIITFALFKVWPFLCEMVCNSLSMIEVVVSWQPPV